VPFPCDREKFSPEGVATGGFLRLIRRLIKPFPTEGGHLLCYQRLMKHLLIAFPEKVFSFSGNPPGKR
jgi:hypothetical protein